MAFNIRSAEEVDYPITDKRDWDDFCADPLRMIETILQNSRNPKAIVRVDLKFQNPPGVRYFDQLGRRILPNKVSDKGSASSPQTE